VGFTAYCVGTGYGGLTTPWARVLVHHVTWPDVDPAKVYRGAEAGQVTILEPGLEERSPRASRRASLASFWGPRMRFRRPRSSSSVSPTRWAQGGASLTR